MLILILIPIPAIADCESTLALCDTAVTALEQQNQLLKKSLKSADEYTARLELQRDSAYKRLSELSNDQGLPWYFWALMGGAATTILIEINQP